MILDKNLTPQTYKDVSKFLSSKLWQAKQRADEKGMGYDIDHAFIMQLLRQSGCRCLYCGKPFVFESNHDMNFSIDRIDSSKGYLRDNVQVIATWVNRAKNDIDEKVFFGYIENVYKQVFTNTEK